MSERCPLFENCPIYSGILKDKIHTTEAYRIRYCDAGEKGRTICKRWQVREKYGKCPPDILPNTPDLVIDIGRNYGLIN